MKTSEFLNMLENNQGKSLIFEYLPEQYVGANYHITEVKNAIFDTVDCGAKTDFWKETIVQIWESPSEIGKREYLSVSKALAILKKADKIKPISLDAELKIEFGNKKFHTTQLFINDFEILDINLIIKLATQQIDCKAKETCGVSVEENACVEGSGCC